VVGVSGTERGECNECGSVFDLIGVDPDKMACPECGSRDWVNEPRSLQTGNEHSAGTEGGDSDR